MNLLISLAQSDIGQQLAASVARSVFAALGGFLIAKGYLSADLVTQLTGAGMAGFAGLWSMFAKLNLAAPSK